MDVLRRIALALIIIGAINWGLIGFFNFDLIAAIFGGQDALLSRIIYAIVGISGLYALTIFYTGLRAQDREDWRSKRPSYSTEFSSEFDQNKKDE